MKEYTIKTVDVQGNVIGESNLVLKEGNVLINQMPEGVTLENMQRSHDFLTNALKNKTKVITIPHDVQLKVLEIK